MKKLLLYVFAMTLLSGCCSMKNVSANKISEAMTNALSQDGTVFIKSWGVGKKLKYGKEDARKNAVKDVLFRGIPGSSIKRPLISDPSVKEKHAVYFETFFADEGPYLKYVKETSYEARDVIRSGCYYKIGIKSKVYYLALQKELENASIIKKFGL